MGADMLAGPMEHVDEVPRARPRGWVVRFARNRGAVFGGVLLLAWIVVALAAPSIAPHDPVEMLSRPRRPPSADFWLGTDLLGRDVFSRILVGSQISLRLGVISVVLARCRAPRWGWSPDISADGRTR